MANEKAKQSWGGKTEDIILPQLKAEFWTEGKEIKGALDGWRDIQYNAQEGRPVRTEIAYRLLLNKPIEIDGENVPAIELAPLAGMKAAFKSIKQQGYSPAKGDVWVVRCTSITKAKREGFSDSPNFEILASRN